MTEIMCTVAHCHTPSKLHVGSTSAGLVIVRVDNDLTQSFYHLQYLEGKVINKHCDTAYLSFCILALENWN